MGPPLQLARPESFHAAPFGKALVGPSWLIWAVAPTLIGSSAWGVPSADELRQAFDAWEPLWARLAAPLALVTDVTRLAAVPDETFAALSTYVKGRLLASMIERRTRQLVLVPADPTELVRSLGVGFLPSIGAEHAFQLQSDVASGAAWLAHADALTGITEAGRLTDQASGEAPLLRALRVEIERDLVDPPLDRIAAALSLSLRTLQRRLAVLGTSFRDEVTAARCRAAARQLAGSEAKIDAIARRVGFDSASHFAVVFRRELGVGPSEYRAQRR